MKPANLKKAAIAAALLLSLPLAQAGDWTGSVGGGIGSKHLDDSDWGSLDTHDAGRFMFEIKKQSWPVSITFDLIGSYEEDRNGSLKEEVTTIENHVGVRKTFALEDSKTRPYIGGGLTQTWTEIENTVAGTSDKDDDSGTGLWLGAGWNFGVTDSFDIGFDLRYSEVEVTLFDQDLEAGGMHYAATASYRW